MFFEIATAHSQQQATKMEPSVLKLMYFQFDYRRKI